MKKYIIIVIFFFNTTFVFSQIWSFKYGIETDVIPFHEDNLKESRLFSLSGFFGGFVEFDLTNQFRLNAIVGINNIYAHMYYYDSSRYPEPGYWNNVIEKKSVYRTTFEVKIEPRYYLFSEFKTWGNIYMAIPFSYETSHFQKTSYKTPKYKIIPSLGYLFNLSKHLSTEVYGGIGFSHIRYKYDKFNCADYLLGVRLRYSFR